MNPIFAIDFYKADHRRQYPEGTTEIYSNFTARKSMSDQKEIIFFGLQYFIKKVLIEDFNNHFFNKSIYEIEEKYKKLIEKSIGISDFDTSHIKELHKYGRIPLRIKSLKEGNLIPCGIPLLTIKNTHPDFFWLVNYIETAMSSYLWKSCTSATTAFMFKKLIKNFAERTGASMDFINFQGHDFSFRGMSGIEDAALSGAAHLTSFYGTDTVPAIELINEYYSANLTDDTGFSVPATEHSVMCAGGKDLEFETIKRLITEVYPTGIVSIVCDTWDFFNVLTNFLPKLKDIILNRNGKVVIRPDSGNPEEIICGINSSIVLANKTAYEHAGAAKILWDIFGGKINEKGYKVLDDHIGLIYGDGISYQVAVRILDSLRQKRFSSQNIVFGIGSYTYQYVTRDTYGFAMKATSCVVNGERREIFKDPITDNGTKKSLKGLIKVIKNEKEYKCFDQVDDEMERQGELSTVFNDGVLVNTDFFNNIRIRINENLEDK